MAKNTENTTPGENTEENTTDPVEEIEEQPPVDEQIEPADSVDDSTDGADDDKNPNAEAAKWRKKLRETEARLEGLAAKVEAYQRAEVEAYAAHLQKPSAIWASGIELKDLLDDDGNIDPGKAQTAVQSAAEELGLMNRPRTPQPHPAQQGSSGIPGPSGADRFADIIAGRDR